MTMSIGPVPVSASTVPGGGRLVAERLSDRLAALLSAQLEGGTLRPGDRLPSEQQIAVSHGVSRTVVREAVHQLKSRGLLLSRQGSGVYVAQGQRGRPLEFDPSVLGSVDAYVQIVEVRRVLEGEIAALAAARATQRQVAALQRALAAIDAASARARPPRRRSTGYASSGISAEARIAAVASGRISAGDCRASSTPPFSPIASSR